MDILTMIVVLFISVSIAGVVAWLIYLQRKTVLEQNEKVQGSKMLQLQAYERLTLLVDRITLNNVITRVSQPEYSARDFHRAMLMAINEEFNYNISQQVYVSPEAWKAIKNLKEQNLLVVNQLSSLMPPEATGYDFARSILEFLMNDQRGSLHDVVSEVVSFEAKKLL